MPETTDERKASNPRLKAAPMASNPKLAIGIGEKGGISVYNLGRFPVTLYKSQWAALTDDAVIAEIKAFITEHSDLLAEKQVTGKASNDSKPEQYKVNSNDLEIALQESARLAQAGDTVAAVRFATIANVGKLNGGKVSAEDMLAIMQVKARK